MRAWWKSFVSTTPEPPSPKPFAGLGVYFTSGVHSPRCSSGYLPAAKLVDAMASILSYQTAIIEAHGGVVEQFVGDCVIAYWASSDLEAMVVSACETATEVVHEKVKIAELEFRLRIGFAASDLVGAFFGPPSDRRFQVVGKARDRANNFPPPPPGTDGIFTDAETFALMPTAARIGFVAIGSTVYSLQSR